MLSKTSPKDEKIKTYGNEHALNAIFSLESLAILKVNPEACSNLVVGIEKSSVLKSHPS
jgi:hypothetical protein